MAFPASPLNITVKILLDGTWTDITSYVYQRDPVSISPFGRTNETSSMQAGQLTLTVNNRDGRFTPLNASGAYYPNVQLNTQLRLSVDDTSADGTAYSGYRFWGEVSSWPVSWNPNATDVYAQVTVSGIWRRLSQSDRRIGSPYGRYNTLLDNVAAYWTMEDGTGSTEFVSAVAGQANMTIASGTPSLAATSAFPGSNAIVQLAGSEIGGTITTSSNPDHIFFRHLLFIQSGGDDGVPAGTVISKIHTAGTVATVEVSLDGAKGGGPFRIRGYNAAGTAIFTDTVAHDVWGIPLLVQVSLDTSGSSVQWGLRLFLPNTETDAGTVTGTVTGSMDDATQVIFNPGSKFQNTSVGHAVVIYGDPAIGTAADALGGWQGERAGARFTRICAEEGITSELSGTISLTATLGPQSDGTITQVLQAIEDSDGGFLYETRSQFGLGYRTVTSLQDQTAALAMSYTDKVLATPLSPTYDDSLIRNDITLTDFDGWSVRVFLANGADSIQDPPDGVGPGYSYTRSVSLTSHDAVTDLAEQILNSGCANENRYPAISVNLARTTTASLFSDVPSLAQGDYLQITDMPDFMGGGTEKQLVWGWTETIQTPSWSIAFNTIPEAPWESSFNPGTLTSGQVPGNAVSFASSGSVTGASIAEGAIVGRNLAAGTITGGNIASGTISAVNIAAATITGDNIGDGEITGTQIASATIDGTNIKSATIDGGNIKSGTITGGNIGSATITGSNIEDGTITAAQIEDATITSAQISATAGITGSQIDGGTITAGNIQDATITNVQIASGSITGSNIDSGTITADNIEDATITSVQISNGTITATQIASGGLTASLIGNVGVLNPNPYFTGGDSTGWTGFNGTFTVTSTPPTGAPYPWAGKYVNNGTTAGAMEESTGRFPASASTQYQVTAWVYSSVTTVQIGFDWRDSGGSLLSNTTENFTVTANTWTQLATVQTSDASAATGLPRVGCTSTGLGATIYAQAVEVRPEVPGGLIQSASITSDLIAAGAITADLMAANSVTALTIAANALDAQAITAASIGTSTLTASTIYDGVINGGQIILQETTDGIFVYGVTKTSTTFTSSGTYTPPSGATKARVQCWGGGGGGAASNTGSTLTGGGGGGGAYDENPSLTVSHASTYTVTIGAGGTGGGSPGAAGTDGGETTFKLGSTTLGKAGGGHRGVVHRGGDGGTDHFNSLWFAGGNSFQGTFVGTDGAGGGGGAGSQGSGKDATGQPAGAGGSPDGGAGGNGGNAASHGGLAGAQPGGGGGGGSNPDGAHSGGAGGAGQVIVTTTVFTLIGSICPVETTDPNLGTTCPAGIKFTDLEASSVFTGPGGDTADADGLNWTNATLLSSFTTNSNDQAPRYAKDPFGMVHLDGTVYTNATTSPGDTAFTLPTGFRPASTRRRFINASTGSFSAGTATVTITTDGFVNVGPVGLTSTGSVCLDGITFPTN